jgi:exodeoxyribonuclease-3
MRIVSFNANGLRSAASKGFFDWFAGKQADVLCLQETKAQVHQLSDDIFRPRGYHAYFRDATTRKGYSGVAIYTRQEPDEVRVGLDWPEFDDEGRYIEARFGNLSVVSFYIPSESPRGGSNSGTHSVRNWGRAGTPAASTLHYARDPQGGCN